MNHACALLLCLVAAGVVSLPAVGKADIGPIVFQGGSVSSMSPHDTILMDSMEITIRLKKTHYVVDAVFHLFNEGSTITQWVGFPKYGAGAPAFKTAIDFIRFDAWVDGRKEQFSEERDLFRNVGPFRTQQTAVGQKESRWMVKQLAFLGRTKTTIRVRYESRYAHDRFASYYYGTGRYWKGNIGKAAFIIDATDIGGIRNTRTDLGASPGPRLLAENLLRYEIENFEPSPNAQLDIECKRHFSSPSLIDHH
jgi:hypothetical protein